MPPTKSGGICTPQKRLLHLPTHLVPKHVRAIISLPTDLSLAIARHRQIAIKRSFNFIWTPDQTRTALIIAIKAMEAVISELIP